MKKEILLALFVVFALRACIEEKDTEKEKPQIELLSPLPCDTLYFGETFHYTVRITDNTGLGNISMDLHNNFGHHNHGNHTSCSMDAAKEALYPYANAWIFSLPEKEKDFVFDTLITLPAAKNDSVLYDYGDYHFHIYVTDNDGYQVFTSLDVKILNRLGN
ncbi:MAG: DUF4625 domain-containing protein [Bacteroidales bacterium]|nr:DUF4625 domain-containing protein [Bacteroidales bacterium]